MKHLMLYEEHENKGIGSLLIFMFLDTNLNFCYQRVENEPRSYLIQYYFEVYNNNEKKCTNDLCVYLEKHNIGFEIVQNGSLEKDGKFLFSIAIDKTDLKRLKKILIEDINLQVDSTKFGI